MSEHGFILPARSRCQSKAAGMRKILWRFVRMTAAAKFE